MRLEQANLIFDRHAEGLGRLVPSDVFGFDTMRLGRLALFQETGRFYKVADLQGNYPDGAHNPIPIAGHPPLQMAQDLPYGGLVENVGAQVTCGQAWARVLKGRRSMRDRGQSRRS